MQKNVKYPVVGLISTPEGEVVESWTSGGQLYKDHSGTEHDLVREHVPLTYRWYRVFDNKDVGLTHPYKPDWDCSCVGLIKLAFDPSGNLVIDKCEIMGAQPNG